MTHISFHASKTSRLTVLAVVSAVVLSSCSSSADSTEADSTTMTDPWLKTINGGMTAAFGVLNNGSGTDVTIVSASTDAAATVELHETSTDADGGMAMSPVEGGFVVPAGGSLNLEPGSFHIMLMGVADPIEAGTDVEVTLTFSDNSTMDFTATAKDFSGADENYGPANPSPSAHDMDGMDMGTASPGSTTTDMESDS